MNLIYQGVVNGELPHAAGRDLLYDSGAMLACSPRRVPFSGSDADIVLYDPNASPRSHHNAPTT